MAKSKAKPEHYVNNKEFLAAMVEFRNSVREAEKLGKDKPRVPNYVGECFLKIANHLSYRPNFINYTYRDDMISDGIENCLQYLHNFNPDKSNNPFAYFTQIIYYAFIRRIQKEKKQTTIKQRMIAEGNYDDMTLNPGEDRDFKNQFTEFLQKNMAPVESGDMDPGAKKMPKRTTLQHKKKLEDAKKSENSPTK